MRSHAAPRRPRHRAPPARRSTTSWPSSTDSRCSIGTSLAMIVPSMTSSSDPRSRPKSALPDARAIASWKARLASTTWTGSPRSRRIQSSVARTSASCSSSMRSAASRQIFGSTSVRTSSTSRKGAPARCRSSSIVLSSGEESGASRTGPPCGPGLRAITPWNSRSRSASRSVPRPVPYRSSISRSGSRSSPGCLCSRPTSITMRSASSMAALGGRLAGVRWGIGSSGRLCRPRHTEKPNSTCPRRAGGPRDFLDGVVWAVKESAAREDSDASIWWHM